METPLPGHGDIAARVPDHRPGDFQYQAAAENCAPQARSRALGSGTPSRRDRAVALRAQAQPGHKDYLGPER